MIEKVVENRLPTKSELMYCAFDENDNIISYSAIGVDKDDVKREIFKLTDFQFEEFEQKGWKIKIVLITIHEI